MLPPRFLSFLLVACCSEGVRACVGRGRGVRGTSARARNTPLNHPPTHPHPPPLSGRALHLPQRVQDDAERARERHVSPVGVLFVSLGFVSVGAGRAPPVSRAAPPRMCRPDPPTPPTPLPPPPQRPDRVRPSHGLHVSVGGRVCVVLGGGGGLRGALVTTAVASGLRSAPAHAPPPPPPPSSWCLQHPHPLCHPHLPHGWPPPRRLLFLKLAGRHAHVAGGAGACVVCVCVWCGGGDASPLTPPRTLTPPLTPPPKLRAVLWAAHRRNCHGAQNSAGACVGRCMRSGWGLGVGGWGEGVAPPRCSCTHPHATHPHATHPHATHPPTQTIAAVLMLVFMLVGGFYVRNIPAWIAWLRWTRCACLLAPAPNPAAQGADVCALPQLTRPPDAPINPPAAS